MPAGDDAGGRRVLITGVAGVLAGDLAARFESDDGIAYVAGIDLREPRADLARTEFVRGDLRNPLVAKLVESARIDTIVHLAVTANPHSAGGRARMKEHNVIGTMQLLGAAQKAPTVRTVVVKSSTAVYGADYADPSLFRESAPTETARQHGYGRDVVEVEGYARAFGRRREDVRLTILRFANFIGPTVDTPLTRYLSLPVVPTVLGYDPRLQLCHQTDAVQVLARAVHGDHHGTVNVAGPGIVYLSQAIRLLGRVPMPLLQPFATGLAGFARRGGRMDFSPEQLRLLMYGRVGDISRLREEVGYEPAYSTREALLDFLASGRARPLVAPDAVRRAERGLAGLASRAAALRGAAS